MMSTVGLMVGCSLGLAPAAEAAPSSPRPPGHMVAPVVDIDTGIQDLRSGTVSEETRLAITARLDATVLFGKDSARLRPGARAALTGLARQLQSAGGGSLVVAGYTDDLGSARHGLVLSRQRAGAVARQLRIQLDPGRFPMRTVGYGERHPAVPNTTEANRRLNRRVLVTLRKD